MTALTPDDLARIEELAEKATPGPWFQGRENARYEGTREVYSKREPNEPDSHDIAQFCWDEADAEFIAAARTAVPALVAGVRSLQARITELEAERDDETERANTAVLSFMRSNEHVAELKRDLDARFEHSDHQSAKYYQRMRKAEIREAAALAQLAAAEADRDAVVNDRAGADHE